MPSAPTHSLVALALAPAFTRPGAPRRIWVLGALCAALPDLDFVGFALGVPYDAALGHRGVSHSLAFAAALALAVTALAFPRAHSTFSRRRAALYLFLATASHGILDMATNGGLGIALWWPFEAGRHFFALRPIEVSPLGLGAFLSARGLAVLESEAAWVWLPAALFALAARALRSERQGIDARGWPSLDDAQCAALFAAARDSLAKYVADDGAVAFAMSAHVVTAVRIPD